MRVPAEPLASHRLLTASSIDMEGNTTDTTAERRDHVKHRIVLLLAGLAFLTAACGGGGSTAGHTGAAQAAPATVPPNPQHSGGGHSEPSATPTPPQSPVQPETNPPGDIPDNTQFVPYTSKSGGFTVTVPSGWSRRTHGSSVAFSDKLNTITLSWQSAKNAPSVHTAKSTDVPQLSSSQLAFRLQSVKTANLPAGNAVVIDYQANSKPNGVTGKQYRLVVLRYELFDKGTQVVIDLSSPVGADNVDPWNTVTQGFKWS